MNKLNLQLLIDVVGTMPANRHYFPMYQALQGGTLPPRTYAMNHDELMNGFNLVSAFGYMAISDQWREAGGSANVVGEPVYAKNVGLPAFCKFLDMPFGQVRKLMCGVLTYKDMFDGNKKRTGSIYYAEYYKKDVKLIELDDVLTKLRSCL